MPSTSFTPSGVTRLRASSVTEARAECARWSSYDSRWNLRVADVSTRVSLSLFTDFENFSVLKPDARHEAELATLLDQVIEWGRALKALRGR